MVPVRIWRASSVYPVLRHAGVAGILVAFIVVAPCNAAPPVWKTLGPWGLNDAWTFAIAPSLPERIYIAPAWLPVQRSDDRGETWNPPGEGLPFDETCVDLCVSPYDANLVIAAVQGTVYRTKNAGNAWVRENAGVLPSGVQCVCYDPSDPAVAYAGGLGAVSKSTNGGRTWSQTGPGLEGSGSIQRLSMDAAHPGEVLAATEYSLRRTTDGGASWHTLFPQVSTYLTIGDAIARSPSDPSVVYVALNGHGFQRSTDGGNSFSARFFENGFTINGLTVHPTEPSTVYALCTNSWYSSLTQLDVRRSTDGGVTWAVQYKDVQNCFYCYVLPRDLALDPVDPNRMYFAKSDASSPNRGKGFMRSDAGPTGPWVAKAQGIAGLPLSGVTTTAGGELLARGSGRLPLFQSFPPYATWSPVPAAGSALSGSASSRTLQSHLSDPGKVLDVVYDTGSDTGGAVVKYRRTETGPWYTLLANYNVINIVAANRHSLNERIYFWIYDGGGGSFLYRNTASWFSFEQVPATFIPTSAVVHPEYDDQIIASGYGAPPIQASWDAGSSWYSLSNGLPSGVVVRVLVDPANPNHLAAVYTNRSPWESTDFGTTWTERPVSLGSATVSDADWIPATGNILLATTGGMVSSHWGAMNEGLSTRILRKIHFDSTRKEIFAIGSLGVYSRKLVGFGSGRHEIPDTLATADRESAAPTAAGPHLGLSLSPNPFREELEISFTSPAGGQVQLSIYDLAGRLVRRHGPLNLSGEPRRWTWNGHAESGESVTPGIYFVRLISEGRTETRKIVRAP